MDSSTPTGTFLWPIDFYLGRLRHYTNLLELDSFGPYDPQSVLCDYETGLHNAIQTVWPSTTLRGCYFHYKQALWRALQRTDLVPEYNVLDSDVRKYLLQSQYMEIPRLYQEGTKHHRR